MSKKIINDIGFVRNIQESMESIKKMNNGMKSGFR